MEIESKSKSVSGKKAKEQLTELLSNDAWDSEGFRTELLEYRPKLAVNPLFSLLLNSDPVVRSRAVWAMGIVVDKMAQSDMEGARIVMRRFMWSLNDESGGIGWGAPEAMAEIMAVNGRLADEYSSVYVSYLNPDGNLIEYDALQAGLLWGFAKLSKTRPELIIRAAQYLEPYLGSGNSAVRGYAAMTIGNLKIKSLEAVLEKLLSDDGEIKKHCISGDVDTLRVSDLAGEALTKLRDQSE